MASETTPTATTVANYINRMLTILVVPSAAVIAAVAVIGGPRWAKNVAALAAYLAVVAAVAIWLLYRGWRSGVRFDDHGVTIRKIFRTQQSGWPEVSHFADGSASYAETYWVPVLVLRDGRAVKLREWAWGGKESPSQEIPAVIAGLYGIAAELTPPGGRAGTQEAS